MIVSSASTRPLSGSRAGLTMARRRPSFTTGACQRRPPLGNIFGTSVEEVRFA
jgi:hypothetical protein